MKPLLTSFTVLFTLLGCAADRAPAAESSEDEGIFYLRWAGDRYQGAVAHPAGGEHRVLIDDLGGHRGMSQFRPRFAISDDGTQLAARIWRGTERAELRLFDLTTGESAPIDAMPAWAIEPPLPADIPERYRMFGGNRALLEGGGFIYSEHDALVEHRPGGGEVARIACGPYCIEPDVSGERIAYLRFDEQTRSRTLSVVARSGGKPVALTAPSSGLERPLWIPFDWR